MIKKVPGVRQDKLSCSMFLSLALYNLWKALPLPHCHTYHIWWFYILPEDPPFLEKDLVAASYLLPCFIPSQSVCMCMVFVLHVVYLFLCDIDQQNEGVCIQFSFACEWERVYWFKILRHIISVTANEHNKSTCFKPL